MCGYDSDVKSHAEHEYSFCHKEKCLLEKIIAKKRKKS